MLEVAEYEGHSIPIATGSHTQDKIIEMLGSGVPATVVANAVGVTDGYISQLLAVPEIHARVVALRTERSAGRIEHDDTIIGAERRALELVKRNLDNGALSGLKPMEALKHFQVLNAARKSGDHAASGSGQPSGTVVNLHLPENAKVQFSMTVDKQVIEIDGRSMATMPASRVNQMLREKKAKAAIQGIANATTVEAIEMPSILQDLEGL